MKIINTDSTEMFKRNRNFNAWKMISRDEAEIIEMHIKAGMTVPSHITPVDVIFYIIEGQGSVTIGDETENVHSGDFIFSPKAVPHSLKADSEGMNIIVTKTPSP
ncbi:MAG: cupin domain-containing protein [candidate division WOR-3 bacterium]|nr:cupin domain-containing protein [candidate division WOR-3 bacterium]